MASCGKQPPTAPHGENRQQEVGKSSLTLTFTHGDDRCQGQWISEGSIDVTGTLISG